MSIPRNWVGRDVPHESADAHVSGQALYADDLSGRFPNLLHAWPVMAPHAHARVRGILLDLVVCRGEPPQRRQAWGVVGVQGHPAEDLRVLVDQADGEPGRGQVTTDLHDARHTDPGRLAQGCGDVDRLALAADVEMGVVVEDRDLEWIRELDLARHSVPGPKGAQPPIRASSSSTTESSSLVKTGAGLTIGVPTTTGVRPQRGVLEYSPVMTG